MKVFDEIQAERDRQDEKWGEQNHAPATWMLIAGEEFGEAAKALLQDEGLKYRWELVQLAAVCVAMIESFDRNEGLFKSI